MTAREVARQRLRNRIIALEDRFAKRPLSQAFGRFMRTDDVRAFGQQLDAVRDEIEAIRRDAWTVAADEAANAAGEVE